MTNIPTPPAETVPDDLLRDSITDYCARALPLSRLRALRGATPPFAQAAWREMAELGWLGLAVPEARGGLGLGAAAVATMARELGRVAAPEPLIECGAACGVLLGATETTDDLAPFLRGEVMFTMPLTTGTVLRAERTADGYTVKGTLDQLPLAPDVAQWLLPAHSEAGLLLCRVARTAPGVTLTALPLADGTRDGRVAFDAVTCDAWSPLGAETLTRARALAGIGGSAYLIGLCSALLDMTLEYLRTRRQFGRALGSFQALQHRAVDMYLHLRLSEAALGVAIGLDGSGAVAAFATAAARARHRAVETTTRVVREAIQLHGAIGYTEPCDVSLFVQRALVMSARFGDARRELGAVAGFAASGTAGADGVLPAPLPDDFQPAGGDWNTVPDPEFRSTVRHWVERHYPAHLRHAPGQLRWAELRDWHGLLVARGWAAPAWPPEHGGMGLAPDKMIIFIEELERWGVARAPDQGIVMIGPILMEYGTAAQRARYLAKALTGEQIWCQGYSEPNAGSDLASLATSAVLDGDEFVVNGQKTWTTHGLDATHMYCLVRTDPKVKPQAGISFLLIDLDQPGVTVRPIVNLGGHVDFCEVFLDNVRVPRANLVGELNQGWTIAKSLLGHERLFVGSPKLCRHALHQLQELVAGLGRAHDPVLQDALLRVTLDVLDLEALYGDYAAIVKRGGIPGVDISVLKIWSTETYVKLSEMILETAGPAAGVFGRQQFGDCHIDVLSHFYNARPAPIYAGSNEIQRNILAKAVLGLPA